MHSKSNKKIIGDENITANTFRIQAYDLIMCGVICIGLTDILHQFIHP